MIRLRELRKAKGLTMKELGEAIGVTESAVGLYENGRRKPDYEKLQLIARTLGCSIDELFAGPDDFEKFSISLSRLRNERGMSISQFAQALSKWGKTSVQPSSVKKWESGEVRLSESSMRKVAEFFGVPFEEMLVDRNGPTEAEEPELPEITMIARAGKKMSPERRQDMLKLLKIAFPEEFSDGHD